ncbi:RMD1 family protein [Paraneptunicella aestuarii]|uniref:RMD1 family protein n=1 Tax=Paraneptunicella aestuarii TaxID=2831148 RepID=UPI001E30D1B0|nr:RMD1 family protein [Paraneptunicella aestuarii]UAA40371.1 RMD1 family protein [Paraneptunicella aestuarii]
MKVNNIDVITIGNRIDIKPNSSDFPQKWQSRRYRDALHIKLERGTAFLFDYGVIVTWSLSKAELEELKFCLESLVKEPIAIPENEQFHYEVADQQNVTIHDDTLSLPDDDALTLLAISHALAQSAKLEQFEIVAEQTVTDNNYLSQMLAKTGKIPLNRKQLAKLRGKLFMTKSDILLRYNLLDTPEFFWEYPEQEAIYMVAAKYLDLKPRVELLTMKLETISELLEMLASEQNHKHSSFLEWIIIILIAMEMVLLFVE